ncbi:unnamed protein product [Cuscuta campestris]|uniref:SWIM-type domain-containing protein n=1 Tax=Cuscuta campestris TaxID=132261 RepID=A0A484LRF3_9ASTE|nr:unnamed protein product [Cuscuta campestris]
MDSNIKVLVCVDRTWDTLENFTSKYDTVIHVPSYCSLCSLIDTVKADISMDWSQIDIRFSYIVAMCPPPIIIADDSELLFYLKLKCHKNEMSYLPLCIEFLPSAKASPPSALPNPSSAPDSVCEMANTPLSMASTPKQTWQTSSICIPNEIPNGMSEPSNDNAFHGDHELHNNVVLDGISNISKHPYTQAPHSSHADTPSLKKSLSFNDNTKRTNRCKRKRMPTNAVDAISHYHPTTIQVDSIYKSKEDLCHHLQMFGSYHSCPVDFREGDHRQATSAFIADLVRHRYVDATRKQYSPNDIRDDMRREFGIAMSYRKAQLVKQKALNKLYGTDEESYQQLPSLCYMLDTTNPGSSIHLARSEDHIFKYLFFSLAPWRQAWDHCASVLVIDGTFMKSYYKGTLLTACCQDAIKQLVPIAFGICDAEDKESWTWFLTQLKTSLTARHDLYIVSDRHEGIIHANQNVFPNAGHGFCTEHIAQNMCVKFRGPKEDLTWMFRKASRATTEVECEEYLQMLDEQDHRIRAYLSKIGQTRWARCKSGPHRFSVMTSHAVESMNNVNNSAREYPISKLVDFIRERMQKWFHERFQAASSTTTILPKKLESELISLQRDAFKMKVKPACPYEFKIVDRWTRSFVVNLRDKTCTCDNFQLDQFICVHAVAAVASRPGLSCYNFISPYYKRESLLATYSGIVHPLGDKSSWDIPSGVQSIPCRPPSCSKRPRGRPKKRRLPSIGEFHYANRRKKQKCTRCLKTRHNMKTCKNPIPA